MERISTNSRFKEKTFLISSNNPKVFEYCTRVIEIQDGEIVYDGNYEESHFKVEKKIEEKIELPPHQNKVIFLLKNLV